MSVDENANSSPEVSRESIFPKQLPPRTYRLKPIPSNHKQFTTHYHIELSTEEFEQSEPPRWLLHDRRHKGKDLASLVQAFCERTPEELTVRQREILEEFKSSKEEESSAFNLEFGSALDVDVLYTYFDLFDEFFFFDSMRVRYGFELQLEPMVYNDFHGQCTVSTPFYWFEARLLTKRTLGWIFIQVSENQDRKTRLTFYLGTLLHQMIHTFLAIYACRVRRCNKEPDNEGIRSHGEAWQDIAFAVERGAKNSFNLDLELCREQSYVWECAMTQRYPTKSPGKVSGWGFDREELCRQIDCCDRADRTSMLLRQPCCFHEEPVVFRRSA